MNREVLLFQNKTVEIKRRAFKRSIGVTLQVNGRILVSAPKTVPLRRIQQFLEKHSEWIHSNLEKYEELRQRYPQKLYVEGEGFYFLGEILRLTFAGTAAKKIAIKRDTQNLTLFLPNEYFENFNALEPHPSLAPLFVKFYEGEGRAYLSERIKFWSSQMQLFPSAISFRSQKTRWGSCTSQGKLSFNWRLIFAPPEVIDYVIIHELAHLRFHNHSKNFWNLVAQYCPQYMQFKGWLKAHQFEADFLSRESEIHPHDA